MSNKATKIFYIEDEPFLGKIVKESLESRNFEVKMLADGRFALKEFQQFKPDICVLDVMLPNKDGYAIGNEIRQQDSAMPIIFLTAKTQTEDVLKGFQSGGNDYIRKPFSMEELIVRINNLLNLANKKTISQGASILLGEYEFFPQKYELTFQESTKKLSYREAELLKIFSENRNFTISRKEILMKIWGDDSFFNSRNLDVYITKLREYLKNDSSIKLTTLKGIGYHFSVGIE